VAITSVRRNAIQKNVVSVHGVVNDFVLVEKQVSFFNYKSKLIILCRLMSDSDSNIFNVIVLRF